MVLLNGIGRTTCVPEAALKQTHNTTWAADSCQRVNAADTCLQIIRAIMPLILLRSSAISRTHSTHDLKPSASCVFCHCMIADLALHTQTGTYVVGVSVSLSDGESCMYMVTSHTTATCLHDGKARIITLSNDNFHNTAARMALQHVQHSTHELNARAIVALSNLFAIAAAIRSFRASSAST